MLRPRRTTIPAELVPHAIVWRPLRYFSTYVRNDQDDLDEYEVASFDFGNQFRFDLRTYPGYQPLTVTVFLPSEIVGLQAINDALDSVLEGLEVPAKAIAWRRGEDFEYGVLVRSDADRLKEKEARVIALKMAARRQNKTVSTERIKKELPKIFPLSALDLQCSTSRPRERLWQQIIGNVISHGNGKKGIFGLGQAIRTVNGLTITDAGMDYLKSIGFSG